VLIGTHLYNGDRAALRRQQWAVEALQRLSGVDAVNVQFQSEPNASLPGIETLNVLGRDSLSLAGPGRRKPVAREVFDALADVAARRGHQYFAYINSDIQVLPAALDAIARRARQTYAISRHDVDRFGESSAAAAPLTSGTDMFVLAVPWWQRHRRRFRPYLVGDICWDNVYTSLMMCHSDGIILNRERLILHERHATRWDNSAPCSRYNGFLAALDARYFDLWCQYWERLEAGRARRASAADESRLRDEVFVWRPSAGEALRQSVRSVRAHIRFRRLRASAPGSL
jgi:hypothetical protein